MDTPNSWGLIEWIAVANPLVIGLGIFGVGRYVGRLSSRLDTVETKLAELAGTVGQLVREVSKLEGFMKGLRTGGNAT